MERSGQHRTGIEMTKIKSPRTRRIRYKLLRPRQGPSTTRKLHESRLRDNVNNSALKDLRKRLDRARSTMRSIGKGPMRRTARRTARREGRRVARKTARRGKRKNRR